MKKTELKLLFTFSLFALLLSSYGQTIPVTPFSFDQDLRFLQLNNNLFGDYSLTIKPISFSKEITPDTLYKSFSNRKDEIFKERKVHFFNSNGKVSLLPIRLLMIEN